MTPASEDLSFFFTYVKDIKVNNNNGLNKHMKNYNSPHTKKSFIVIALFFQSILCNASPDLNTPTQSLENIPLEAYPDLLVTITNGDGLITQTLIACYQNASNCTGGNLGYIPIRGNPYIYTSGNTYKANFARVYENGYQSGCQSTKILLVDGSGATASSPCLAVTCSSIADCTFTPNTTSITF